VNMRRPPSHRLMAWTILAAGIGSTVLTAVGDWLRLGQPWFSRQPNTPAAVADLLPHLSSTSVMALAAAGLMVLLFSRAVPRWWSLAYAVLALGMILAIVSWGADIGIDFAARMQQDPDALFTARPPRLADYMVIASRLILGVAAPRSRASPLLPPRPARPVDVPKQPLGLDV